MSRHREPIDNIRSRLRSDGVIPDVIIIIVERSLNDFRRLLNEIQKLWRLENTGTFILS